MDKKLIATVRGDHRGNVAQLVAVFFEESDERSKINIENEKISLELVFNGKAPEKVIRAIGECGIISLEYSGTREDEAVTVETVDQIESEDQNKKRKKTAKTIPEISAEELTKIQEAFDRELKTSVETAKSVSELGEEVGKKLKLSPKPRILFTKLLEYSFKLSEISLEK